MSRPLATLRSPSSFDAIWLTILFTQYTFNAFIISQVSRELGLIEDWQKYQNRSRGWENLWNPDTVLPDIASEQEVEGIRGFMQVSLLSDLLLLGQ